MVQFPLRLLMFNLMTDTGDPVLGFTTAWIEELASHCEYIDVITMYKGDVTLPDNVRVVSAGRELGLSQSRRVLNFYRHLLPLITVRSYDACFAHMMPLFAGLAGPLLTVRGIPTVLWYTHRQKSRQLRLGLKMARYVVTAVKTSFPYETKKLRVIGHGINTDFFGPRQSGYQPQSIRGRPVVVQVARLAAIKHQETVIKAIGRTDAHLVLVGDVQQGYPTQYKQDLVDLAQQLNIRHRVTFAGDLPPQEVRDWYQQAALAINMSPVGLFDKATLESMACGVPTIVCNPEFGELMGDFRALLTTDNPQDVDGLHNRITKLLAMSENGRGRLGQSLREHVIERYSLEQLMGRLIVVLRDDLPTQN